MGLAASIDQLGKHTAGKVIAIWEINNFRAEYFDDQGRICETAHFAPTGSKLIHSCEPNTVYIWIAETHKFFVHAMMDIKIGQEITITYAPLLHKQVIRQAMLQETYRFKCMCKACGFMFGVDFIKSEDTRKQFKVCD